MDFKAIRKTAIGTAILKGHGQDAEDFAQDVAVEILKGRDTRMNIHLIDWLRKEYGRTSSSGAKTPAYREKRQASPVTEENGGQATQEHNLDFDLLLEENLDSKERAYMILLHRWDFTLKEIGDAFGVSESRVAQQVREIHLKLKKAIECPNLYYVRRAATA
jgi:RNA polymerase sigma factor (sigma-70 family)